MNTFSSERIRHKKAEAVYLWRVPRLLKKSAHEQISLSSSNLRFKTFQTSKYINI